MKKATQQLTILASVCALALAVPFRAEAQVSEEDFKALKRLVEQLTDKVQRLEQGRERDQQTHERDQQRIDQLKQQLEETQKTATDAQQKVQAAAAQVQPTRPLPGEGNATHNFMMVGDAEIQFGKVDGSHSAFALADFAPIFLFRARDNILFEAGFDINLQNGSSGSHDSGVNTSVGLSFAQLDYMFNDYVTFVGGDMLLPLGTYSERAAGFLNKIPDDPLPRDLLPGSGIGVQLRGAVPVGKPGESFNYAVYAANGPGSSDGTGNHDQIDFDGNVGLQNNGNFGNLHGSPSAGGRLGWFYPWKPHYDVELGVSGQSGTWDDQDRRRWSAGVLDAAVHISPYFEMKGEYVRSWQETDDLGTIKPNGWWLQAGYKLAGLNLEAPLVNNLELVGRYDTSKDGVSTHIDRYTLGYVYYFSNTLLFEGDYEIRHSNDKDSSHNFLVFQISYGF